MYIMENFFSLFLVNLFKIFKIIIIFIYFNLLIFISIFKVVIHNEKIFFFLYLFLYFLNLPKIFQGSYMATVGTKGLTKIIENKIFL